MTNINQTTSLLDMRLEHNKENYFLLRNKAQWKTQPFLINSVNPKN